MERRFKTQTIAQLAMLSAVATVLLLLEFPVLPAAPYLQLNFSDFPALIAAFAYGPLGGLIVTIVKIFLEFIIRGSNTGGVGMLANLIIGVAYTLPAGLIYQKNRTLGGAVIALAVSSATMVVAACFANYFIMIPLMIKNMPPLARFNLVLTAMLPFNAIKVVATSLVTFFTYKPLGKLLKLLDIKKSFVSQSPEQTESYGASLAKKCTGGEVFVLEGKMGAGKTVFAKGFAEGLGVTDTVTSPTYAIHNIYQGEKLTLNHFDFYRLDEEGARNLGLDEAFKQPNSVCLVEWGQNVKGLLPENSKVVRIRVVDEQTRELGVLNNGTIRA